MAASERVFGIPELTNIICSYLDRGDCVRLLRVSRCLFSYVRHFVWEDVEGAIHLLRLFPGTMSAHTSNKRKKVSSLFKRHFTFKPHCIKTERPSTYESRHLSV